ncbi:MAG: MerR family transcriptional regulator [Ectothiorhodospiraceae bacterium]|nr:MerR family transcriptional regulator [Ectothiorhodospiraceae bacterium]
MRIAELESRTGVSRHALRYYEREGLLREVQREANNYRSYSEAAVRRVQLLRQLQQFGFSLAEIRAILDAMRDGTMDCTQGAALMAEQRAKVADQIANLQQLDELLATEQRRLETSAARQRETGRC